MQKHPQQQGINEFKSNYISDENKLTFDPLTGLGNDYLFRIFLPDEFIKIKESKSNSALIVIKLDNIIAINQIHGRTSGDEALLSIAHLLENFRAQYNQQAHRIFRIGGPIFSYYVPGCTPETARNTAEEIHEQVLQSELYIEKLTVSIGIATFTEFYQVPGSSEQLAIKIERTALKRLEIAEQKGANTICDSSIVSLHTASDRHNILVIEPDMTSIELLIKAIEAEDFEVQTAEDGESAINIIQATPPNIIICEVMTPRLNGFTIRERLRTNAIWNTIPFILISHKKNEEFIRKAVDRDIRYFFKKPLSIIEITGLISNIMRSTT